MQILENICKFNDYTRIPPTDRHPKHEVEEYLSSVHSDCGRYHSLDENIELENPALTTVEFDESYIKWKEVQEVVKKARAKSAPRPSGIPYQLLMLR